MNTEWIDSRHKTVDLITKLIREGWTPESARDYAKTGNLDVLKHSGYFPTEMVKASELEKERLIQSLPVVTEMRGEIR